MLDRNASIFIAGHTGMVGSHLVKVFLKKRYSNLILKTRQQLDLLDQRAVNKFFHDEKPSYVILSAAKVGGIQDNMYHQADFLYENLQIQNNVIWAAHMTNVKKLLFLGSSCIYPKNSPQPMKEEYFMSGKLEPTNEGYAIAKIAGMELCSKIFLQYGKCFISCMPTNIYGPNDNFRDDSAHVIPSLIRKIHESKIQMKKSVTIWGSGSSRREFLFVEDLADAIYWIMNNYDGNDFLNIGTGTDISIRELAGKLKRIIGFDGRLIFDTSKPDGMPKKLVDSQTINSLGWQSTTDLDRGLRLSYSWYLSQISDKNEQSL
jgi:GDP-L-fucose synthase